MVYPPIKYEFYPIEEDEQGYYKCDIIVVKWIMLAEYYDKPPLWVDNGWAGVPSWLTYLT